MAKRAFEYRWPVLVAGIAAGVLASGLGHAQAQPAHTAGSKDTGGLEEVVVTARKTEENLQTTPVAVTAVTEADLTQKQLADVVDLGRSAPDVAVTSSGPGGSTVSYLSIRGQAKQEANSVSDSAVATYVDGVYYARPVVGNLGFLDVGGVEILRGPQGTLFGRNTTGGALNITSKQPTSKFEGNLQVGYGNFNERSAEGAVNVPLMGEELAARVAAQYSAHNAYFNASIPGGVAPGKVNSDTAARATVRWAPAALPLTLTVSGDLNNESDTGVAIALAGYNPAGFDALGAALQSVGALPPLPAPFSQLITSATGYNPANFIQNSGNFYNFYGKPSTADPEMNKPFGWIHASGVSATLDADIGPVHLKSITAYRTTDNSNAEDLDGSPVRFLSFVSEYIQHQKSEELQLSGKAGKFDLIGGLYYFQEGGSERSDSESLGVIGDVVGNLFFGFPAGTLPAAIAQDMGAYNSISRAAFFQTNYHITDTIRATAGYRYTWDGRELTRYGRSNILSAAPPPFNTCAVGTDVGNPPGAPCSEAHGTSFGYPAYVFSLDWQATDHMFLYVKTSKASMAGGFNTRPVPNAADASYGPESNQDVEVGMKNDALDNHLRTNLAVFYAKQSGTQNIVSTFFGGRSSQYTTNAGDSKKYGVELEVTALPVENLEVQLSGAYLHAAYVEGTYFEQQTYFNPATFSFVTATVDRAGEPVPLAPKFTFSLGATQTIPVSYGKYALHADYAYKDKEVYNYETPAAGQPDYAAWVTANQLRMVPGFGLLNARISLTLNDPNIEFAIWGRNLTEKQYNLYHFSLYEALGVAMNYAGDPRTFGATINYRF